MSISGSRKTTSEAGRGRPDGEYLVLLRAVALVAGVVGAVGSIGLMLWAGHRNPSALLIVLFAIWVLSPFVALVLAHMVSERWSVLTQATLYGLMLVVSVGSLAVYGARVLRAPKAQGAFVFVVVPPASWLLIAVAVPTAALMSRRRSRRGDGA